MSVDVKQSESRPWGEFIYGATMAVIWAAGIVLIFTKLMPETKPGQSPEAAAQVVFVVLLALFLLFPGRVPGYSSRQFFDFFGSAFAMQARLGSVAALLGLTMYAFLILQGKFKYYSQGPTQSPHPLPHPVVWHDGPHVFQDLESRTLKLKSQNYVVKFGNVFSESEYSAEFEKWPPRDLVILVTGRVEKVEEILDYWGVQVDWTADNEMMFPGIVPHTVFLQLAVSDLGSVIELKANLVLPDTCAARVAVARADLGSLNAALHSLVLEIVAEASTIDCPEVSN